MSSIDAIIASASAYGRAAAVDLAIDYLVANGEVEQRAGLFYLKERRRP